LGRLIQPPVLFLLFPACLSRNLSFGRPAYRPFYFLPVIRVVFYALFMAVAFMQPVATGSHFCDHPFSGFRLIFADF
jgi:hypothetical protein